MRTKPKPSEEQTAVPVDLAAYKQAVQRQAARPARETVRIECLRIAMERVTVAKAPRSIIDEAREFEAYVLEPGVLEEDAETE